MARVDAKPGDWNTHPLPQQVVRLDYARRFTAAELARLRRGLVPEQMEDKWFVVWHDDALWLHRSWTGRCIFRLRFRGEPDGGGVVDEALVNRDPREYGGLEHHDLALLDGLLSSLLAFSARFG